MTYGTGAWIAITAGAAAKRRQMLLAEEEEMTQYTQDDLTNDWEFKIVRSESAAFRRPEALNKLVDEEAQAGWTMLEKLDDRRVRFKRPRSDRAKDAYLPDGVDPYRTRYGAPSARYAVLAGALVAGGLVVALGILGSQGAGASDAPIPWIAISTAIPAIIAILVLVKILILRRK